MSFNVNSPLQRNGLENETVLFFEMLRQRKRIFNNLEKEKLFIYLFSARLHTKSPHQPNSAYLTIFFNIGSNESAGIAFATTLPLGETRKLKGMLSNLSVLAARYLFIDKLRPVIIILLNES